MGPRLLLFGLGNPSRGDDALGTLLLERAEGWLSGNPGLDVVCIADFQLQIEHVLDLQTRDMALFLDADATCRPPFEFRPVQAAEDPSLTTHELSPAALLEVFRRTLGQEPPPSFLLGVRGCGFGLGAPLSQPAAVNLEAAWTFLQGLLAMPQVEAWCGSPSGGRVPEATR